MKVEALALLYRGEPKSIVSKVPIAPCISLPVMHVGDRSTLGSVFRIKEGYSAKSINKKRKRYFIIKYFTTV